MLKVGASHPESRKSTKIRDRRARNCHVGKIHAIVNIQRLDAWKSLKRSGPFTQARFPFTSPCAQSHTTHPPETLFRLSECLPACTSCILLTSLSSHSCILTSAMNKMGTGIGPHNGPLPLVFCSTASPGLTFGALKHHTIFTGVSGTYAGAACLHTMEIRA